MRIKKTTKKNKRKHTKMSSGHYHDQKNKSNVKQLAKKDLATGNFFKKPK